MIARHLKVDKSKNQAATKRRCCMNEKMKGLCTGLLAIATWPWSGQAQTPGAAILRIDIANYKPYTYAVFEIQKLATTPVATALTQPGRAFAFFVIFGDIVAFNVRLGKG